MAPAPSQSQDIATATSSAKKVLPDAQTARESVETTFDELIVNGSPEPSVHSPGGSLTSNSTTPPSSRVNEKVWSIPEESRLNKTKCPHNKQVASFARALKDISGKAHMIVKKDRTIIDRPFNVKIGRKNREKSEKNEKAYGKLYGKSGWKSQSQS